MMKFAVLGLIVLVGLVSADDIDDFSQHVQDVRSRLNGLHNEIDYHLRDSRWNVSDVMADWNTDILSLTAESVTAVHTTKAEVYALILAQAGIAGNQAECIIDLDNENTEAATAAGESLRLCSEASNEALLNAVANIFFDFVNGVQKESMNLQQLTLNGLGQFNPMTQRDTISSYLENLYQVMALNWPTEYVPFIEYEVNRLENARAERAVFDSFCHTNALNGYNTVADALRESIPLCTE